MLQIIDTFNKNVKNVKICLGAYHSKHSGKEGHWLEKKMGIVHNAKNEPDLLGYEMKKSSSKITLGDFSAAEYAFSAKRKLINAYNNWTDNVVMSRTNFIKFFGNPNPLKSNRYSWSGTCVPRYNEWSANGQMLTILDTVDIVIYYSFSKDKRHRDDLPEFLKHDDIVIAVWTIAKLTKNINSKFNVNGFFLCKKIGRKFQKICFGKPFGVDYFIQCIKNGKIIFYSGMYDGNSRNYSQFRGNKTFWDELVIAEY